MEKTNNLKDFMVEIKRAHQTRKHKVTNSYDTKDFYRNYIKGLDKNSEYYISEKQYGNILKVTNDLIMEKLLEGFQVVFPYNLGCLQIESSKNKFYYKNGELKTTYMIDWNETIKLWFEDDECRKNKTFVRRDNAEKYIVRYHHAKGKLKNKTLLYFLPCRRLTDKIEQKRKEEGINAIPR